ncbi:hypothetical protein SLEP1_g2466 [Rubroshorea leprosula]|uniref:Uncharacterized protein n=1 Tax=Rubroshorea leprosula TaxID=152421 RepID=A0AAV5HPJ7_9ROSI|nr:hypothetical protein SLEP1_g2466 [Rubroshorea leprosula]
MLVSGTKSRLCCHCYKSAILFLCSNLNGESPYCHTMSCALIEIMVLTPEHRAIEFFPASQNSSVILSFKLNRCLSHAFYILMPMHAKREKIAKIQVCLVKLRNSEPYI